MQDKGFPLNLVLK